MSNTNELENFLRFLSMFDLTESKIRQLIAAMNDDFSLKHFCRMKIDKDLLSEDAVYKMRERAEQARIDTYIKNLSDQDIILITRFDERFPESLRVLPDAPYFLFCKGDISLLKKPALSVVGTRKPSSYGRVVTNRIVSKVAKQGIVIVSGLAYGIDSLAHRACLDEGGNTIAVLGSGFNRIYPPDHQGLADEIAQKGLLVSEYTPSRSATRYTFPHRNRIIAALSSGTLITEASIKSGTIHTKEFALTYGKNIYSVPGNIDSPTSELTNDIIKSGQARCITCAEDILSDYGFQSLPKAKTKAANNTAIQLTVEEQAITSLLEDGMKDVDFLTKNCGLNIDDFQSCLTMLEIRGIISKLPGGLISLK